jgi:hypothetical protein
MKNIHILPTDKPSRLYLHSNNELQLRTNIIRTSEDYLGTNHNIYITSSEAIKDGDWCLSKLNEVVRFGKKFTASLYKKIILTTNQDLIKDGVQAIDDEFLEWFVKNPSCESVEVVKDVFFESVNYHFYKIIIPQAEPKQIYYNTVGRENGVNVVKGQFNTQKEALDLANELNRNFPDLYYDWRKTLIKEEPKQEPLSFPPFDKEKADVITKEGQKVVRELHNNIQQDTLEEAAEKEFPLLNTQWCKTGAAEEENLELLGHRKSFIKGAKWQAERMYSEEEVEQIARFGFNAGRRVELKAVDLDFTFEKWFEQFKKK